MNQTARVIPNHYLQYKTMKLTSNRIKFLSNKHNTKVGTWGQINLTEGEARFEILDPSETILSYEVVDTDKKLVVPPATWHRLICVIHRHGFNFLSDIST